MTRNVAVIGSFLILAVLFFVLTATGGVPAWNERPFPPGWIGGVIPYVLDEDMPGRARESAQEAMAAWTEATVLRFVPRTNEPDFMNLLKHVWVGVAPIRCRRSRETASR